MIAREICEKEGIPITTRSDLSPDNPNFYALLGTRHGHRTPRLLGQNAGRFATQSPSNLKATAVKTTSKIKLREEGLLGYETYDLVFLLEDIPPVRTAPPTSKADANTATASICSLSTSSVASDTASDSESPSSMAKYMRLSCICQ